ncbi:MAG: hypothetical protein EOP56_00155 [Sphingobacteriales bacterium]|nr:MAG: hypothetical protein EOP56_00155 [Sphingobacteriales bacterium]
MGIVFRQSIKTTLVTFLGALLGAVVILLSTRLLPPQLFGFSRNLQNQALVGSQFVLMGMHSTLLVYIEKYPPQSKGRPLLITISVLAPFILSIILGMAFVALKPIIVPLYQKEDIELVSRYFLWLPFYTLLWGWLALLEQFLISQMKVAVATFMREVVLRILNILLIILFAIGSISVDFFIIAGILVHAIPVLCLFILARNTGGFKFSLDFSRLSREEYKSISDFAFFHSLLNASLNLLAYVDVLMVGAMDKNGMVAVAVYSAASFIISIYQIPYRAMATAATPLLIKAFEEKDLKKVKDLFDRSGVNIQLVCVGMAAIVIGNLQNLSVLGPRYEAAGAIVLVLIAGRLVEAATGLNDQMLSISKHYRFNFYLTIGLVICTIALNLALIPRYGIVGAACSTSISLIIVNLIKYGYLWRKMGLQTFTRGTLSILFSGIITIAIIHFIPSLYNSAHQFLLTYQFIPSTVSQYLAAGADAIVRSAIAIVIYGGMILILKPSPDLAVYVSSVIKNKRLF